MFIHAYISIYVCKYMGRPNADNLPDARVDTQPSLSFEVGLIFIISSIISHMTRIYFLTGILNSDGLTCDT